MPPIAPKGSGEANVRLFVCYTMLEEQCNGRVFQILKKLFVCRVYFFFAGAESHVITRSFKSVFFLVCFWVSYLYVCMHSNHTPPP